MSVTGEPDDAPGGGPQKAGVAITDLVTGLFASTGILAALAHRDRTGRGQHLDASLFDSAVAMMSVMNLNYLASGVAPKRLGNAHPNIVPVPGVRLRGRPRDRRGGQRRPVRRGSATLPGRPEWTRDAAFRDERRSRAASCGAGSADRGGDANANAARLARCAGARRRSLRPDQYAGPGVRGSAGHRHAGCGSTWRIRWQAACRK